MKFLLSFVAGFVFLFSQAAPNASAQLITRADAPNPAAESTSPTMSDREKKGLRGPVKSCVEETTFPAAPTGDGTIIPERKDSYTTEYDLQGGTLMTSMSNTDGVPWVTRYTYDASGRLLQLQTGKDGGPTTQTVYSYDDHGKLLSITDSKSPGNPVTFHYDEQGRKTSVLVSRPEDYRPNMAVAGSPFEGLSMPPNLPGGGTSTTLYDDQDRPIEIQVRDAQGQVVNRALRIYDSQGRISEEKQIQDNPEMMFPAEVRAQIVQQAGASPEEAGAVMEQLRAQLKEFMGGQPGYYSTAYTYDSQGRATATRRRIFNQEQNIETTYNEHGDKAGEITRSTKIGGAASDPGFPPYSETRYSYQYDDHDNWTGQTISSRSAPDGAFEFSQRLQRSLTYY